MNDLDPDVRALLAAACGGDDPSDDDRSRVRRALAATLATTAGLGLAREAAAALPAGTGLGATAGGAAKIGLWLTIGLAAGFATSGTIVAISGRARHAPDEIIRSERRADARLHVAAEHPPALPVAATPVAEARVTAPSVRVVATETAPHAQPEGAPAATLAAETALIEGARDALGRGDARAALRALDEHEQRFPRGVLVEERLASRVFALCGLGRRAEAARAAADLYQRAPTSPLRGRVQASCAGAH